MGLVLGVHTAGMFALSPLSGWAVDRFGTRLVIFTGLGTLAAWVLLIIAWPSAEGAVMPVALFLLGYGWMCPSRCACRALSIRWGGVPRRSEQLAPACCLLSVTTAMLPLGWFDRRRPWRLKRWHDCDSTIREESRAAQASSSTMSPW